MNKTTKIMIKFIIVIATMFLVGYIALVYQHAYSRNKTAEKLYYNN
ncbi:MAG: hypothetical protein WA057_04725 [Candidatus Magasanikiibacteriota bacterium]